MKHIQQSLVALAAVCGLILSFSPVVMAQDVFEECRQNSDSPICAEQTDDAPSMVMTALNVSFYVIGIISVIMVIVGGIRYVTSNGNASQLTAARETILYSVIGLAVAVFSYAIVNFIVAQF